MFNITKFTNLTKLTRPELSCSKYGFKCIENASGHILSCACRYNPMYDWIYKLLILLLLILLVWNYKLIKKDLISVFKFIKENLDNIEWGGADDDEN